MSAWRIGTQGSSDTDGAAMGSGGRPGTQLTLTLPRLVGVSLDALTKWLPAEVVALYATVVTMMQPPVSGDKPPEPVVSWLPWIICLIATPLIVALGAWAARNSTLLWARVGLSLPAFVLWSATVPYSAWNKIGGFTSSSPIFWLVLGLVTVLFTGVAQALTSASST